MAVHEDARGRGYGRSHSRGIGGRDNVTEFYAKHDYAVVGEAETLFGANAWMKVKTLPKTKK